jgi:hypothetical protein
LNLPGHANAGRHSGSYRRPGQHRLRQAPLSFAEQIHRGRPIRSNCPRQPQIGRVLPEILRTPSRKDRINPKQRIERLDFDIELLHQSDGHAAEFREATTDAYLRQHVRTRGARGEKPFDLVGQALRNLLAGQRDSSPILITPRQLAGRQQQTVPYQCDRGSRLLDSHVRFNSFGRCELPSHSGERHQRKGGCDDGLHLDTLGGQPSRCGHEARRGRERHNHRTRGCSLCTARREDVRHPAARFHSGALHFRDGVTTHSVERPVRDHGMAMVGLQPPHDSSGGLPPNSRELAARLCALARQTPERADTRMKSAIA